MNLTFKRCKMLEMCSNNNKTCVASGEVLSNIV